MPRYANRHHRGPCVSEFLLDLAHWILQQGLNRSKGADVSGDT